jgi:thiol-disulfide isomerase/thioredoxin
MRYAFITFAGMMLFAGIGLVYYAHMAQNNSDATSPIIASSPSGRVTEIPQQTDALFNENKPAPELTDITTWLNTDKPLTLQELRGKVVLIDFWTNQCINCIRTLPYVTKWYDTYHDQGFTVIGVHTPELAYEYTVKSIEAAIKQYNIHYPVAQDNNYKTWNAYSNEYWPGFYLIDAKGIIRRTHFGEGEYEETEQAIKKLLSEAKK